MRSRNIRSSDWNPSKRSNVILGASYVRAIGEDSGGRDECDAGTVAQRFYWMKMICFHFSQVKLDVAASESTSSKKKWWVNC